MKRVARPSLWARGEWLWAPALYVGVALALYRSVWLGQDGVKGWFGWDTLESYWGDLAYIATAFRHGDWPMWNPYDRAGYPFHADPQTGAYYPLSWILALGGAIAGGVPGWLIQAKVLAHHALAGGLMHLYLRSRSVPRAAAVFGGVVAIVSAPMMQHKATNVIWPLVWTPLVWLAIDRAVERAGTPGWWRRSAGLAAAVAIAAVAGSPPGFFHVVVAGSLYGAFRMTHALVDAWRAGRLGHVVGRIALTLTLAAIAAALLLALVFLPSRELVALSPRVVRTLGYALNGGTIPWDALREGLAPQLGIGIYGGLLLLAFAALAVLARPLADRGAALFMVAFGGLFACLSFGGHTPILPFLVKHVPGFGLFRVPPRYMILANLALAVAAAHGVAALLQARVGRRRYVLVVALGCLLALTLAVLAIRASGPTPPGRRPDEGGLGLSLTVLAAGAAIAAAMLAAPVRVRGALGLLLALVAYLDVSRGAAAFLRNFERPPDERRQLLAVEQLGGLGDAWRLLDEFVIEQRPGPRFGLRDMRGYPAGDPLEDVRYREVMARASKNPAILEAFNVRVVLHGPHRRIGKAANWIRVPPTSTAPAHFRALDAKRFEALHPVPIVAWYGGVTLVPGLRQALDAIEAGEKKDGVRTTAVVERPDVPAAEAEAIGQLERDARRGLPFVPGRLVSFGANRVAAEVDAPARGLVVLNEKFFAGWRVTVDGKAATPLRANAILRGVVVGDAGRHEIVWTYAPPNHRLLAAGCLAGMGFLLAAWIGAVWTARPAVVTAPPRRLVAEMRVAAAERLAGLRRKLVARAARGDREAAAAWAREARRLEDELVLLLGGDVGAPIGASLPRVLRELAPAVRRLDAITARLEAAGLSAGGLKARVLGPRLAPLVRAALPARVPPVSRDAFVAQVQELFAELRAGGLDPGIPPREVVSWAAAALVAGIEPVPGPSLLASLIAVASARVWPEVGRTIGEPLEITRAVRQLLGDLPPRLAVRICEAELARAAATLTYLEGSVETVDPMVVDVRAEAARVAAEARPLAEIFPACETAVLEITARAKRLEEGWY